MKAFALLLSQVIAFGFDGTPAALLVGVHASDEVDELLGDKLLGHDQLQLVKISPLLL